MLVISVDVPIYNYNDKSNYLLIEIVQIILFFGFGIFLPTVELMSIGISGVPVRTVLVISVVPFEELVNFVDVPI